MCVCFLFILSYFLLVFSFFYVTGSSVSVLLFGVALVKAALVCFAHGAATMVVAVRITHLGSIILVIMVLLWWRNTVRGFL
jgi:hypothetical protein